MTNSLDSPHKLWPGLQPQVPATEARRLNIGRKAVPSAGLSWIWRAIWWQVHLSEAWGPPQFQEKRSRSEKAILGALGEFRGILGAALRIRNSTLGIRMASHDLSNTNTTILGATPGFDGNLHERFSFAPLFSERSFKNWGGPRAQKFEPCFKGIWASDFPYVLRVDKP